MTDEEIVKRAKEAEKRNWFGELVHSPISKGVNSAFGIGFIEGIVEYRNLLQEKPISEELEEAAVDYAEACKCDGGEKLLCVEHFKAGAKWKEQQFEKERLKHCDALTEEQAQMESDFVVDFIKKNNRTPTFIDAIEYGIKLKLKDKK